MIDSSPDQARKQIVALLDDTVEQATALHRSLQQERRALEREDVAAIELALSNKSRHVEALARLDAQRGALCDALGFQAGPSQMQAVLDWCDEDDRIHERWQHLLSVAAESNTMNLTNGAIIRARQQQYDASLSLLRGRTPRLETYGQHGSGSGDFGRQTLAQA